MSNEDRIKQDLVNVQATLIVAVDRVDSLIHGQERRGRLFKRLCAAQRLVTEACSELYQVPAELAIGPL
jgi:hypothetical protein